MNLHIPYLNNIWINNIFFRNSHYIDTGTVSPSAYLYFRHVAVQAREIEAVHMCGCIGPPVFLKAYRQLCKQLWNWSQRILPPPPCCCCCCCFVDSACGMELREIASELRLSENIFLSSLLDWIEYLIMLVPYLSY